MPTLVYNTFCSQVAANLTPIQQVLLLKGYLYNETKKQFLIKNNEFVFSSWIETFFWQIIYKSKKKSVKSAWFVKFNMKMKEKIKVWIFLCCHHVIHNFFTASLRSCCWNIENKHRSKSRNSCKPELLMDCWKYSGSKEYFLIISNGY